MRQPAILKRGFTLIEMLLVVALIALLISILLPSMRKAKEHANVAVCMTRLSQIGNAAIAYTVSNQNRFASAFQWTRHVTCWHDWHQKERVTDGLLFPYVGSYAMYLCPTFSEVYKLGVSNAYCEHAATGVEAFYSYSMNASMGAEGWAGSAWKGPMAIREPPTMLFYSEENTWVVPGLSTVSINNGALGVGPDCIATYHLPATAGDMNTGRGNALFLDLHVNLVPPAQTTMLLVQ